MRSKYGSAMIARLAQFGLVAACAAAAPAWGQAYPKGFSYRSDWLSCFVKPTGELVSIKARDVLLVKQLFLHGTYRPKKREDARFFQNAAREQTPLTVRKTAPNCYVVTKSGILANKRYPEAARFTQRTTLSPNRLDFDYEVEMLVPLAGTSKIFLTLLSLPAKTYVYRGFRIRRTEKGAGSLHVFPRSYSKQSDISAAGLTELRVVLDQGHFVLEAGKDTRISLLDQRGWGGRGFRADIYAPVPWRRKPVTYPAGTHFAWSFHLVFDNTK